SIDTWNYYQAKSMKQNLAEATLDQMTAVGGATAALERYKKQVARYDHEKGEVKEEAEGYEKKYEALNEQHDLFDLCEAALSVGIALLGVTALTRKRWLLYVARARERVRISGRVRERRDLPVLQRDDDRLGWRDRDPDLVVGLPDHRARRAADRRPLADVDAFVVDNRRITRRLRKDGRNEE